jgi:hypothetical protein
MLAHLRTEAYPVYGAHFYPPADVDGARRPAVLSYEDNVRLIGAAKKRANSRRQTAAAMTGLTAREG